MTGRHWLIWWLALMGFVVVMRCFAYIHEESMQRLEYAHAEAMAEPSACLLGPEEPGDV